VNLFHIPTGFLVVGLLSFVMPAMVWFALAERRPQAVTLWCGGDVVFGVATVLMGLRGHVPEWATFPLANLLMFIGPALRIQSLRLDLAVPRRTAWMVAAALLFALGYEGIRSGLGDDLLRLQYNHVVFGALWLYSSVLAWRVGRLEQSRNARWIAGAYLQLAIALLNALFWMSIGSSIPDAMATNLSRVALILAGILSAVISDIAYVGLALERSQRQTAEAEKQYHAIIEATVDGFWVCDSEGHFADVNRAYCEMLGYRRDELLAMRIADVEAKEKPGEIQAHIRHIMQAGSDRFESWYRRKDGRLLQIEASVNFLPSGGGKFVVFIRDITERKQAEEALRESKVKFKILADTSPLAIYMSEGVDQKAEYINPTFIRLFGYSFDEVPTVAHWWPLAYPDETYRRQIEEEWQRKVGRAIETRTEIEPMEVVVTCKDGSRKIIQWGFKAIGVQNWAFGLDLTERKQAEEAIKQLAFYDVLTQLPNRRLLLDRLQQALVTSVRSKQYGALLFIDLDNFKTVNDTLGHDKGDLLLQEVASRTSACVRECDTLARLGGDEFVVLLTGMDVDAQEATAQAKQVGGKILNRLNQVYDLAGREHYGGASMGITLFAGHSSSMDELLKQADIALYQAKAAGRNTLRFFDVELQLALTARTALAVDLHHALARNQFELFCQIEASHNHKVIGVEVLLRWHHPEHGLIPPQEFISLAEETGLIQPIGQWVLETACALFKSWEKIPGERHWHLAVNISVRQFQQPDFVIGVLKVLQDTGLDPSRLMLELTESVALPNVNDAIVKMTALKQGGVRFSLDDFGTGFSSLSYLTRLPFDQLKIDRSFVQNIGMKPSDEVIIETIITMADSLGIDTIAEGVETEAQRAFLERHGCPVCQGYLFGKPAPMAEFEENIKIAVDLPQRI